MYAREEIVALIDQKGIHGVIAEVAPFEVVDLDLREKFEGIEDAIQDLLDEIEPELEDLE